MNKQEEEAWLEAQGFELAETLGDYCRWERGWVSVIFTFDGQAQVNCLGRLELSSLSVLDGLQKLNVRLWRDMTETGDAIDAVEEAMRLWLGGDEQ